MSIPSFTDGHLVSSLPLIQMVLRWKFFDMSFDDHMYIFLLSRLSLYCLQMLPISLLNWLWQFMFPPGAFQVLHHHHCSASSYFLHLSILMGVRRHILFHYIWNIYKTDELLRFNEIQMVVTVQTRFSYHFIIKWEINSKNTAKQTEKKMHALGNNQNQMLTWIGVYIYTYIYIYICTVYINSVQSLICVQLFCNPMDCSTPGFPVDHQLLELAQTHVHWVGDAIQPAHPLSSSSPPAFNHSQLQGLFQWVSSLHQVANILELQLQH